MRDFNMKSVDCKLAVLRYIFFPYYPSGISKDLGQWEAAGGNMHPCKNKPLAATMKSFLRIDCLFFLWNMKITETFFFFLLSCGLFNMLCLLLIPFAALC